MPTAGERTRITDYIDVGKKMADLGCRYPEQMALLPINFEAARSIAEFLQASEAATIKKLLLAKKLPLNDILDRNQRSPYLKNKSHEWAAPILFVSASLFSQNPALVSLALNVVGNYATDFFKGTLGIHEVTLNIVVAKKDKTFKKISYRGPTDGLKDLAKIIKEVCQ